MDKNIGIYKITSPSGKIYIGQSTNIKGRKRVYRYFKSYKSSVGPRITNSLQKYGFDAHNFDIIEECLIEQLDERETHWKQYYLTILGWKQVLFCNLYDMGGGPKSEETKLKIGLANKGQKRTNETKQKMSDNSFFKGKHRSERDKKLIGDSQRGIPKPLVSEKTKGIKPTKELIELRAKNNRGITRNNKIVNQYDLEGNFIKEWNSGTEVVKNFKCDVYACCKGKQKTAGGFIWKYK